MRVLSSFTGRPTLDVSNDLDIPEAVRTSILDKTRSEPLDLTTLDLLLAPPGVTGASVPRLSESERTILAAGRALLRGNQLPPDCVVHTSTGAKTLREIFVARHDRVVMLHGALEAEAEVRAKLPAALVGQYDEQFPQVLQAFETLTTFHFLDTYRYQPMMLVAGPRANGQTHAVRAFGDIVFGAKPSALIPIDLARIMSPEQLVGENGVLTAAARQFAEHGIVHLINGTTLVTTAPKVAEALLEWVSQSRKPPRITVVFEVDTPESVTPHDAGVAALGLDGHRLFVAHAGFRRLSADALLHYIDAEVLQLLKESSLAGRTLAYTARARTELGRAFATTYAPLEDVHGRVNRLLLAPIARRANASANGVITIDVRHDVKLAVADVAALQGELQRGDARYAAGDALFVAEEIGVSGQAPVPSADPLDAVRFALRPLDALLAHTPVTPAQAALLRREQRRARELADVLSADASEQAAAGSAVVYPQRVTERLNAALGPVTAWIDAQVTAVTKEEPWVGELSPLVPLRIVVPAEGVVRVLLQHAPADAPEPLVIGELRVAAPLERTPLPIAAGEALRIDDVPAGTVLHLATVAPCRVEIRVVDVAAPGDG